MESEIFQELEIRADFDELGEEEGGDGTRTETAWIEAGLCQRTSLKADAEVENEEHHHAKREVGKVPRHSAAE